MILHLLLTAFMAAQTGYFAYTSPDNDYSFEVNENATFKREPSDGGYTDNFDVIHDTTKNNIDYTITVTKVKIGEKITNEDISTSAFKTSFQGSCKCDITSDKQITYKNVAGVMYTFKMNMEGISLLGYSFNIAKGETLYSVAFIASDTDFKKYSAEFEHTMNTMKVK